MSSYSEGFPLGLLEAGLMKLPVVCSDIPIFRELFSEDEVCFYQLDNIKSLEKAISICVNNKNELAMSLNKKIVKKYSIDEMGKNYFQLYEHNL
ncbi:Glycosyl transferases group 1 [compost metagenome]